MLTRQETRTSLPGFPELEPHCGSWIVTGPRGRVYETYDRESAEAAYEAGWLVETAARYLGRINREVRAS